MQIFLAFLLAATFQSGEPMPVGTADRLGPLSPGLSGYPVGVVSVYGSAQPDLFAVGGGASVTAFPYGLFLYRWKGTANDGRPVFGNRIQVRQPSSEKTLQCTIPRFRFPVMLCHKGQPILLGQLSGWE
ncbi:MAG TPA: hypothetical protein VN442_10000 [Bryobacteraceae bacterium]|nr:hypothetical protein [Bryobacteraceae bacterium]